jgi:hypothetical protein
MNVALFPLNAVLFPRGILPLRIFEPRYMDMVRDCLRQELPFGVCRIVSGAEIGRRAVPERIGCLATIQAWDMQQLGLLHIRARGVDRFRVLHAETRPDGLQRADVELIEPDEDGPIGPGHAPCVELLGRIIADLRAQQRERGAAERAQAAADAALEGLPFDEPFQLDSRVWVGNRLCEVLPIPLKARQRLMELDDAKTRLDIVLQYLRQHAIVR